MNIENFDPKNTSCGYNFVCKGRSDCQILKGIEHQLIKSVDMKYLVGSRVVEWKVEDANNFLKRSLNAAGNCPMTDEIRLRGNTLINRKFGTSF